MSKSIILIVQLMQTFNSDFQILGFHWDITFLSFVFFFSTSFFSTFLIYILSLSLSLTPFLYSRYIFLYSFLLILLETWGFFLGGGCPFLIYILCIFLLHLRITVVYFLFVFFFFSRLNCYEFFFNVLTWEVEQEVHKCTI